MLLYGNAFRTTGEASTVNRHALENPLADERPRENIFAEIFSENNFE